MSAESAQEYLDFCERRDYDREFARTVAGFDRAQRFTHGSLWALGLATVVLAVIGLVSLGVVF